MSERGDIYLGFAAWGKEMENCRLDLAKQLEAVSPVHRRTGASGGLQVGRILIAVTGKKGVRHQVPTRVLCLDDKAQPRYIDNIRYFPPW